MLPSQQHTRPALPPRSKSSPGLWQVENECLFSKLLSRRWPTDEHLMTRLDCFVQQALRRDLLETRRELTELVFDGHALYNTQLQQLRAAVAADGGAMPMDADANVLPTSSQPNEAWEDVADADTGAPPLPPTERPL